MRNESYLLPHSNQNSILDFRNNVISNCEGACNLETGQFSIVGNHNRPGPNTKSYTAELHLQPKAKPIAVKHQALSSFRLQNALCISHCWRQDSIDAVLLIGVPSSPKIKVYWVLSATEIQTPTDKRKLSRLSETKPNRETSN